MRDGEGRMSTPMRVISLLRRQGRLADLEWATLQSAIHFLQQCRGEGLQLTVAVNVSAESLRLPGFGLRLQELTQRNEQRIAEMRTTLEEQLRALQNDNAQKLEQMRHTVDEKLQSTLETRLGNSFKLVSERLEQVQRGLGEMQQLATGCSWRTSSSRP
ncbi:hypothetical protein G6F64_014038 [Rhizopus arrhizus]|uniref:Uncharacterized protein n=1 Tax=Rhizopus oryzae TaxID=64495 RepID=A0A9P6WUU5_RHIOR|nr:hypothetical protein G6F64_014038 [Rhizopus arrhizus]